MHIEHSFFISIINVVILASLEVFGFTAHGVDYTGSVEAACHLRLQQQ